MRLRKLNHIWTIRGTTAIEGNTQTEDQVTDIIAGKRVVGSKREIDEVKGAHAAYSKVEEFDPLSPRALLRAHALMTKDLVESPGKWRKCNVGVFNARGEAMLAAWVAFGATLKSVVMRMSDDRFRGYTLAGPKHIKTKRREL